MHSRFEPIGRSFAVKYVLDTFSLTREGLDLPEVSLVAILDAGISARQAQLRLAKHAAISPKSMPC